MKTLVIVPAFNEEDTIISTIEELKEKAPAFDYIIVNDGSTDHTSEICHDHEYHILDQPINLGLTGAFQTGMKFAFLKGYDAAIQFDADGQHRPEYISDMVECMTKTKADIVIGSRFVSQRKPFTLRMLGSRIISSLIRFTCKTKINDPTSGMRLYGKEVIEQFAKRNDLSPEPETVAYLIYRKHAVVKECQVNMRDRMGGDSYLTFSKSISYMLNACCSILFAMWFRK